jgi:NADH-quinone oxidoreductase subunit N
LQYTEYIPQVVRGVTEIANNLLGILPEIILAIGIIVFLLLDFSKRISGSTIKVIALVFIVVSFWFTFSQFEIGSQFLFQKNILIAPLAVLLKFSFLVAAAFTLIFFNDEKTKIKPTIKALLAFTMLLGANIMVMASHYLTMFIAIELVSIPAYIAVSLVGEKRSYEAGLKYLLFGAMATAFFLYGVSFLYGITGSLYLIPLTPDLLSIAAYSAIFLVLLGVLFKIGVVPMHIWLPDVYEATNPSWVALLAFLPKVAGVGLLINWLHLTNLWGNEVVQQLLALIIMLSLAIGAFSALWQSNPKRLLAYSSIVQSAFLLVGVVAFSDFAISAFVFYAFVFLIMNYLAFYIIHILELRSMIFIENYRGLIKTSPLIVVAMITAMVSLVGLPPTAGFMGKLLLFSGLWMSINSTALMITFWVAIFSTLVSLFFYFKIIYPMVFEKGGNDAPAIRKLSLIENAIVIMFSIAIIFFFIKSDFLLNFINNHILAL